MLHLIPRNLQFPIIDLNDAFIWNDWTVIQILCNANLGRATRTKTMGILLRKKMHDSRRVCVAFRSNSAQLDFNVHIQMPVYNRFDLASSHPGDRQNEAIMAATLSVP